MKRVILLICLLLAIPAWGAVPFPESVSTSTTTLTLNSTVGVYTFTGSSPATWTLPTVSGNKDRQIIIKNRGSATITVQRAGSDQLYTTSAVTSTTVTAGSWAKLVNDSVYWNVLTAGSGSLSSTDIDTSAELAGILTDETGSGSAVFGTSPTFAGGTVTSSTPIITGTQTWNNAGVQFFGQVYDVTDTASAGNSRLAEWRVGGTAKAFIAKTGEIAGSQMTCTNLYNYGWTLTGGNAYLYGPSANVLELRNSTNAQTFNVYNTYTDASNYERASLQWTSNECYFTVGKNGTGSYRNFFIGTDGGNSLYFRTNATNRWAVGSTGNFVSLADNTYDIGASGANRPKDVYIAGNLTAGAGANVKITANRNALTDYGRFIVQQNSVDKWGIGSRGDEPANNILCMRDETNGVNVLSLYQGASGASQIAFVGSKQGQQAQKSLTESAATAFVQVACASGAMTGGIVHYTLIANDASDFQSRAGSVPFAIVNKAGTETCTIGTASDAAAVSAGGSTLTVTFDSDTSPTNAVNLRANAVSSLTQTTLAIRYWVEITGPTVIVTPQ